MRLFLFSFLLTFTLTCTDSRDPSGSDGEEPETSYRTIEAFPALSFTRPVDLQHPGDDSNLLFVVEQRGIISVFENDSSASGKSTFLDIQNRVDDARNEEGLLGLAFHPDYENNGYFYVNYTASNPDRTVISRFQVSDNNPEQADAGSELEILTFEQPDWNHNGGQLSFGPDGYLYIAVGDGGGGGDPDENGQDRTTLLGSILRIDVDSQEDGNNYAIPPDNPFAGNSEGFREEIYAYGLRNPWRFSFDPENGRLWTGDVGQISYEEIDIIENGGNYGWDCREGMHEFGSSAPACSEASGFKDPIWEYGRGEGISVTGGFVYRGPTVQSLTGQYIYADYGSGTIWALEHSDLENPENTVIVDSNLAISSFGVDQNNELYICAFDDKIYRLESNE